MTFLIKITSASKLHFDLKLQVSQCETICVQIIFVSLLDSGSNEQVPVNPLGVSSVWCTLSCELLYYVLKGVIMRNITLEFYYYY